MPVERDVFWLAYLSGPSFTYSKGQDQLHLSYCALCPNQDLWDFFSGPVVVTYSTTGMRVRPLVGELRSQLLHSVAKKKQNHTTVCGYVSTLLPLFIKV